MVKDGVCKEVYEDTQGLWGDFRRNFRFMGLKALTREVRYGSLRDCYTARREKW
jgi:hypothetical protein